MRKDGEEGTLQPSRIEPLTRLCLQLGFISTIFVSQFSNCNPRLRRPIRSGKNLLFFLHYSFLEAARRRCKLGALPPGACLMVGELEKLAAFLQHHSVFNPSKSVLLRPHTCASDYKASAAYRPVSGSSRAPPSPFSAAPSIYSN